MAEAKVNESENKGKGNVRFEVSTNVGLDTIKLTRKLSEEAIKEHGCFRIAVSGGSFSKNFANGLDELIKLKQNDIDFSKWKVFFADERCVELESDDSNYKGFQLQFMSKAKDIILENVYPINEEIITNAKQDQTKQNDDNENKDKDKDNDNEIMCKVTQEICKSYLNDMLKEFNINEKDKDNIPSFDCIYLGMGPNGHTASLFPGHKLLQSKNLVDFIVNSPKPPPFRITFTLPLICNAKNIIFVVTGASKQDALKQITEICANNDGKVKQSLPSGIVTQNAIGNVVWYMDDKASATAKL